MVDDIYFAEDRKAPDVTGYWKVIIVDDEADIHKVTMMALKKVMYKNKPLQFISAYSSSEAKRVIALHNDAALILLDVVMETDGSGLQLVKYIRDELENKLVRIILRTGQPGEAPEEDVIVNYDINDYKTKEELTDKKLFTTVVSSIRSYTDLVKLKEKNIELESEITKRKDAEQKIKLSLKEKEILIGEIHHRVKNNLQIISSLLFLRSKDIKDEYTLEIIEETRSRIKAIALLHEQLYGSEDLAKIDFNEYIKVLTDDLAYTYGVNSSDITIIVNVKDIHLGIDMAIPCGLIINELVTNALKYAFPRGKGEIVIDFYIDSNNMYVLKIGDNGVGIPKEIDIANTDSFGLRLVQDLVEQQSGKLSVATSSGTMYNMSFPLHEQ
ncbi:histidine kinase dimerization/phosphoacceptor domain -containing protein [Candidatus Magnetomonas plexicatena]|uniref:histidine kinase dimerization/phosphoacceptor domain -containing protein n=1 Tax=Candidatus Magnetomonas plexicatena TaxID=2552947 RepID=UPI004032A498